MTNPTPSMPTPVTTIGAGLRRALPVERWEATGFPGRWVGGTALVLGPLLMLTGALLRASRPEPVEKVVTQSAGWA